MGTMNLGTPKVHKTTPHRWPMFGVVTKCPKCGVNDLLVYFREKKPREQGKYAVLCFNEKCKYVAELFLVKRGAKKVELKDNDQKAAKPL